MTGIISVDYMGHPIAYRGDGWFNATQAAAKFGKEPTAWIRQSDTIEYIAALCKRYGNSGFVTEFNKIKDFDSTSSKARSALLKLAKDSGLVKTKAGAPETGGGTWLHPKLAVRFAQWLDVDFAVWCDEQIDALLRGKEDWAKDRALLAAAHRVMSGMLHDTRAEQGKSTEAHHYANESRLVNWAVCGEFKGLDRNSMTVEEIELLAQLETRNAIMIGRGMSYDERKAELSRQVAAAHQETQKLH